MRKKLIGAVALVALVAVMLSQSVADEAKSSAVKIGDKAPAFSLANHNGEQVSLSDYTGKVVVLEWFNEECPYVVRHYKAKTMTDLASQYADRDVVWLAINSTSGKDNVANAKIAGEWSIPYPILNDATGQVGRQFGAKTTPHMYIIDKDGVVRYMGGIDNDQRGNKSDRVNYVQKALDEVLAGQSVSEPQTKEYGCSVKYAK